MVMTRPSKEDKLKIVEVRKGSCGGRAGNFDAEVRAVREAVMWVGKNKVEMSLIRSDSTAAIARVIDTRARPGQEEVREIKKRMEKIGKRVDIKWVKGHDVDEENEETDRNAKEARTKSQKITTVSYLTTMISRRATRDNYLGILSRHYMFDYAVPRRSTLDQEERAIVVTVSRLRGDCAITGSFLHRIKQAESGRCWRCQGARDIVMHTLVKCRVWDKERAECFGRRSIEEHTRERISII